MPPEGLGSEEMSTEARLFRGFATGAGLACAAVFARGSGTGTLAQRIDAITEWQSREWETEVSLTPAQMLVIAAVFGGVLGASYVFATARSRRGAAPAAAFAVAVPAGWEIL